MNSIKTVCLGGCCDAPILDYIYALAEKKKPKLLYVPTAHFDEVDGDIAEIVYFEKLGCTSEILYLTHDLSKEEIEEKILGADIVFAGGGNLKFLMDTWKSTGADKLFIEAARRGTVLSGVSSGSMCWFKSGFDDCGENNEFMFVDCLDLIPFCNAPHYDSEYWKAFDSFIPQRAESAVALDNQVALAFNDGKFSVIHGFEPGNAYLFSGEGAKSKIRLSDDCRELDGVK